MRVIVTGGTGFIGTKLCERLLVKGHDPVVLTRDASRSRDHVHPRVKVASWAEGAPWEALVDGAGAIVNLSGEVVAQRWTASVKERIVKSRVGAVEKLYAAIEKAKLRPSVLVNASAIGYYGVHDDGELTEASPAGHDFLSETCTRWEEAAKKVETLGVRVVRVRIGIVLSPDGGALAKMLPPFQAFAGGPIGSGKQWMSWIHRDDLVDLLVFCLENEKATGAINGTAPAPVRMNEFATAVGNALSRPSFLPAPAFAVKLLLGEAATIVLDGQKVLPKKAQELGFTFRHPEVQGALRDLLS